MCWFSPLMWFRILWLKQKCVELIKRSAMFLLTNLVIPQTEEEWDLEQCRNHLLPPTLKNKWRLQTHVLLARIKAAFLCLKLMLSMDIFSRLNQEDASVCPVFSTVSYDISPSRGGAFSRCVSKNFVTCAVCLCVFYN